jgi:hypothetical protein
MAEWKGEIIKLWVTSMSNSYSTTWRSWYSQYPEGWLNYWERGSHHWILVWTKNKLCTLLVFFAFWLFVGLTGHGSRFIVATVF